MIRRPFLVACVAALASAGAAATEAGAISVTCTGKPSSPAGYAVTAVGADRAAIPPTTPAIAVLDTGVADVPELQGRLRSGRNVASDSPNTNDIDGHGTAVASIAAAVAGGVRGISPSSPIIPIKIFDDRGESTPEDFVAGIAEAIDRKAGVINISASALSGDVDRAAAAQMKNAIDTAVSLGIPVVSASGNEGQPALDVPATYPHVIAVGATDASGALAPFSNTGRGLDLVAPGDNVTVAAPTALCSDGYGVVSGTSFAAPAVAGAAALLLQAHPDLDVGQVTDMLRLHGGRPAWSLEKGFGLLDVPAALSAPVPAPDQPEVNDDVKWARLQPAVLTPARRARSFSARLAPHTDPADVYRLKLKKGDRLSLRLRMSAGSSARLSFGSSKLGAVRGSSLRREIGRTGTYFVGVTLGKSPDAGTSYKLSLRR